MPFSGGKPCPAPRSKGKAQVRDQKRSPVRAIHRAHVFCPRRSVAFKCEMPGGTDVSVSALQWLVLVGVRA